MTEKHLCKSVKLAGKPVDQDTRYPRFEPGVLDDHGHGGQAGQRMPTGQKGLREATELLIDLIFEIEVTHAE